MHLIHLLSACSGLDIKTYIENNDKTFSHFKGALAEQFVFQEITAADDSIPVYYWAAEKNTAEIEFLLQYNGTIIPLEVKAGKNTKSESLKIYREQFKPLITVCASLLEYSSNKNHINIPLYMTGSIKEILSSKN